MQIKDWGEEEIVGYLAKRFPVHEPLIGIGDDCAVLPNGMLVTTDGLLEGIHFIKEQIPPRDLGYKLVAVNVSDMAAKGGSPKYAFLTMALPLSTDAKWLKEVIDGIAEACAKWDIQLLGGDTDGSKRDLFFNLMLIGSGAEIKYRHEAKPGDTICVTGYLGDAGAGLRALQKQIAETPAVRTLIHAHFHPEPSPAEGQWLAKQEKVHAMMDISDGLDLDLNRLIKASKCSALVERTKLPLSTPLLETCEKHHWDTSELALSGGEDYCLIATVAKGDYESLSKQFHNEFGHPLFAIGEITDKMSPVVYHPPVQQNLKRYDHFHN